MAAPMFTKLCMTRYLQLQTNRELIRRNAGSFQNYNPFRNVKASILLRKLTGVRRAAVGFWAAVGVAGSTAAAYARFSNAFTFNLNAASIAENARQAIKPIRQIRSSSDNTGLKITLYQYQSCPFCCKVRAFLDFHGFSYDVIEVNSLRRSEIKWSKYKKVPILACDVGNDDPDEFVQMNDSSLIISILATYLEDRTQPLQELISYYPVFETQNEKGKTVYEFPNKYFIMYGERRAVPKDMLEVKKWRQWTDDVLVHMLSPNIYRTPSEALKTFRYFSEVGEWDRPFSMLEKNVVIYIGAFSMFIIGKILKKRHNLHDDVRIDMYDACRQWTTFLAGRGSQFMGGSSPNLADLAVYGVISAIEGSDAFRDIQQNTDISSWYFATKQVVRQNAGKPE